jgi:hypothetical protein
MLVSRRFWDVAAVGRNNLNPNEGEIANKGENKSAESRSERLSQY